MNETFICQLQDENDLTTILHIHGTLLLSQGADCCYIDNVKLLQDLIKIVSGSFQCDHFDLSGRSPYEKYLRLFAGL